MTTSLTRRRLLLVSWLAAGGVVLTHGTAPAANRAAGLSVCIDTTSASAARDQKIAEAVAHREGMKLAVEHFTSGDDDDGFSAKQFRALIQAKCSLVMGFPIDPTPGESPGLPADLMTTKAYGETGFVFVVPSDSTAKRLADLPQGSDVAVTYGTAPNLYFLTYKNVSPDVHLSDRETLATVAAGHARAGLVWGPTFQAYLAATPGAKLNAYKLDEPHARWNIVALYQADSAADAARFDDAVATMGGPAALERIAATAAESLAAIGDSAAAAPPITDGAGPPALYTEAQAKQGAAKFSDNCEQCHGTHLEGRAGPALKGPHFASAASKFTVGDIFDIVSQNMPASNPGSLEHDDYVQIMAFLLQQNGYPAGAKALTFADAGASKVSLVYRGN